MEFYIPTYPIKDKRAATELPLWVLAQLEELQTQVRQMQEGGQQSAISAQKQAEELEQLTEALLNKAEEIAHRMERVCSYIERFNADSGSGTLERDQHSGVLHLKTVELVPATDAIKWVWVNEDQCVGIPGNTMTVKAVTVDQNKRINVELYSHSMNPANILDAFDGSTDTWVEWERVVIKAKQRMKRLDDDMLFPDDSGQEMDVLQATAGKGWKVLVGLLGKLELVERPLAEFHDDPHGLTPAKLALEMEFQGDTSGMWLEIVPYHIGGQLMVLERLEVSDDGANWKVVYAPKATAKPGTNASQASLFRKDNASYQMGVARFEGSYVIRKAIPNRFMLNGARYARMVLSAGGWYEPTYGFGHRYAAVHVTETKKTTALFGLYRRSSSTDWWERVDTEPMAVGTLVIKEDQAHKVVSFIVGGAVGLATGLTSAVVSSVLGSGFVAGLGALANPLLFVVGGVLLGGVLKNLFGSTKVERRVDRQVAGIDVFKGWRSAVGIREIRVVRRRYEPHGVWTSDVITFPKMVKQVIFYPHHDVPEGTSVSYTLIADGAQYPMSSDGKSVVNLNAPAANLQVRVEMTGTEQVSPVLYSFGLEGYA